MCTFPEEISLDSPLVAWKQPLISLKLENMAGVTLQVKFPQSLEETNTQSKYIKPFVYSTAMTITVARHTLNINPASMVATVSRA